MLKEQSNVERHHPEICYDQMLAGYRDRLPLNDSLLLVKDKEEEEEEEGFTRLQGRAVGTYRMHDNKDDNQNNNGTTVAVGRSSGYDNQVQARTKVDLKQKQKREARVGRETRDSLVPTSNGTGAATSATDREEAREASVVDITRAGGNQPRQQVASGENAPLDLRVSSSVGDSGGSSNGNGNGNSHSSSQTGEQKPDSKTNSTTTTKTTNTTTTKCLDLFPLFVAQSSICCYVLSFGLSCYLLDLLLRKWRRSKCPIQLLQVSTDLEGNLIELVMSNNHRRFRHWLPGQFVYLNCPQVASFEWHPFTISSMNTESGGREFTLHIKTGGDWTRKLRRELELRNGIRMGSSRADDRNSKCLSEMGKNCHHHHRSNNMMTTAKSGLFINHKQYYNHNKLELPANFDCYNQKTGKLEIQCTRLARLPPTCCSSGKNETDFSLVQVRDSKSLVDFDDQQREQYLANDTAIMSNANPYSDLHLFIDGPFHSPFERLLDQQVSVCIANGVGWTAFSSVFQCITATKTTIANNNRVWWSPTLESFKSNSETTKTDTRVALDGTGARMANLYLMIIVTSIEQLRPFYNLALNYFYRMQHQEEEDPVREIRAFITRCEYMFISHLTFTLIHINNTILTIYSQFYYDSDQRGPRCNPILSRAIKSQWLDSE